MTDGEQRIAIAKACGWTHLEDRSHGLMMPEGTYVSGYPPVNAIVGNKEELPDYTRDLNAMHEAERHLGNGQHEVFERHLQKLAQRVELDWISGHGNVVKFHTVSRHIWHATAAQRAEAFLKALNLWKE